MRVALAQPHRRDLPDGARRDQKAESVLGRLCLKGVISEAQYEAGEKYRIATRACLSTLAAPAGYRGTLAGIVAPGTEEEPKEETAKQKNALETEEDRTERVLAAFDEAQAALGEAVGNNRAAFRLVAGICCGEAGVQRDDLPALKAALQLLVRHWRLDEDRKGRARTYAPGPAKRPWGRSAKIVVYEYE